MSLYEKGRAPLRPLTTLPESRVGVPRNTEPRSSAAIQREFTSIPTTASHPIVGVNPYAGESEIFLYAYDGSDIHLRVLGNGTAIFGGEIGTLTHTGSTAGFYDTTPIAKQTGVAVTAAAIHAALVNLGLIGA